MVSTNLPSACNILFLSEVMSGKSAVIEFLQNYADPDYTMNRENIGSGMRPCIRNIETSSLSTNLPSYFVSDEGERVCHVALQGGTQDDYEDEFNDHKKYPQISENNIALIFKAMESIYSISLVVITISNTLFTEELKDVPSDYVRLFPEFNGGIVFVKVQQKIGELKAGITEYKQDLLTVAHNLASRDSYNLRTATPGYIHHVIDHIDIQAHNVKVLQKSGGKGQEFWAVKFRRKKGHNGLFHAKVYITKKKMFAAEIETWRAHEVELKVLQEEYQTNLDIFEN
ncbi:hypothetical protein BG003_009116 [Podila horticola]|nr:hypothetical protein BG003_009116 [Podila horticola]